MQIEIVNIGDEVVRGSVTNTNGAFLATQLRKIGLKVSRITVLPDDPVALEAGLKECWERADLIIGTGGLGPTLDDKTKQVVAALFQTDVYEDLILAEDLKTRYGLLPISIENQIQVPKCAKLLQNAVGTAPGLLFEKQQKALILLPGVPKEMEYVFIHEVLPYLERHFRGKQIFSRWIHISLLSESAIDPVLRTVQEQFPSMEIGIYPAHGVLTVSLFSPSQQHLSVAEDRIRFEFAPYIFSSSNGKIEEALHEWMLIHKKTLAFAESCTGGSMARAITALPGASDYFLGSFVTYSNRLKKKVLSVQDELLNSYGSVSKEVVQAMWEGAIKQSDADYVIAVSGIAGPSGGSLEKPVGTIWAAVGEAGTSPEVGMFMTYGSREAVITSTVNKLFSVLYRKLLYGTPCFPLISNLK